jgi:hypothetical protein
MPPAMRIAPDRKTLFRLPHEWPFFVVIALSFAVWPASDVEAPGAPPERGILSRPGRAIIDTPIRFSIEPAYSASIRTAPAMVAICLNRERSEANIGSNF